MGPRRRKGILPHEPTCTEKNLKELPQEGAWREFVVGAELTPMVDGHLSLVKEIKRRLEHAVSRGLEATAFIAMAAQESENVPRRRS